jgi:hypothetical protein
MAGLTSRRGFAFVVAAVAIAVLGAFAVVDEHRTEDRVPAVPEQCPRDDAGCTAEFNDQLGDRLREARRLEDGLEWRAWIYAVAAIGAVAVALFFALRDRPPRATQRRVFADLGVLGVVLLLAASALLVGREGGLVALPWLPAYAPGLAALVGAAIGGTRARLLGGATTPATEGEPRPMWRRLPRYASWVALAATGVMLVLAVTYVEAQPACDSGEDAPGWTNELAWTAVVIGIAAVALSLVGLAARRWFVALLCVLVNPAAGALMLLSSWCGLS